MKHFDIYLEQNTYTRKVEEGINETKAKVLVLIIWTNLYLE